MKMTSTGRLSLTISICVLGTGAFMGLSSCKHASTSNLQGDGTQLQATNDPATGEPTIDMDCAQKLENDDTATCNLFADPMLNPQLISDSEPPDFSDLLSEPEGPEGRNPEVLALTGDQADSGNLPGISSADICASLRDKLQAQSVFLQLSLGAEYSNLLMDQIAAVVWQQAQRLAEPTVNSLEASFSRYSTGRFEAQLNQTIKPYLDAFRKFECPNLSMIGIYYSRSTIFARAAQLANDLVREIPIGDFGYRRNGSQRLISRIVRNIAVNRAEAGRAIGIYRNLRDKAIASGLAQINAKVNAVSQTALQGTALQAVLSTQEIREGYYWLSLLKEKNQRQAVGSGRIRDKVQQLVANLQTLQTQIQNVKDQLQNQNQNQNQPGETPQQ